MKALVAAALTIATMVVPWLVWTPLASSPAAVIICGAIALVGACHGFGRILGRIAHYEEVDAALAVQWGVATLIGVAGVMLVFGVYSARLLLVAGTLAHTADSLLRFRARWSAWEDVLGRDRLFYATLPATLLGVLALVHVLAGAGAIDDRAFDDDTNIVAQVARLDDSGALGDAIGYPRVVQLGGRAAFDGLVAAFADPRAVRLVEGLALALVLWLACARLRPRDATSAIWASLVVIAGSAFTMPWPDRLPLWLPAGLLATAIFTLHDARRDTRSQLPLVVLAGALVVLRIELAPVGLILLVATWWLGRGPMRQEVRRLGLLFAIFAGIVAAYAVAREAAWSEVDSVARTLIEPRRGSTLIRLFTSLAIGFAVLPALLLVVPRETEMHTLRWLACATAAGIGGVAGKIAGERLFGVRSLWILTIAAVVVLVVEVSRRRELDRLAFGVVIVLSLIVWEARSEPGRGRWSWRYYELMHDVEYTRHASTEGGAYAEVLATVPAGDRIAVWVTRPELLDYARYKVIDLRTPRAAKLRDPIGSDSRLRRLVHASRARWLLFEVDEGYHNRRPGSRLHELLCPRGSREDWCTDALERIMRDHPVVASQHGIALFELRR